MTTTRRSFLAGLSATAAALALAACAGEGNDNGGGGGSSDDELVIDFATYNPLSLIIKEKGWLEAALKDRGTKVTWIQSAGSNKANEGLRSGTLNVGSTAGSAALLARANGSPIKAIDIYSQPEWSALVTRPDTGITTVADLRGKSVAATKGTDPYFFLLQSLATADLKPSDITIQNLQHADGRAALDNKSVDAWSGLDPIMAAAERAGDKLFYRNVEFNTYGFLNATEDFLSDQPDLAQTVVNAYEAARAWAKENTAETAAILAKVAAIDEATATKVIGRTNLDVDPVPGEAQRKVLDVVSGILVDSGDVKSRDDVTSALASLFDDSLAKKADPAAISTT